MKSKFTKIGFLTFLLTFAVAITSFAQDTDSKMTDMKDDPAMMEMMKSQHHRVMTTYRQSLLGYAETLRDLAKDSADLNADFAKALFEDIERSSRMMDAVHKDHMSKMDSKMKEKMAPMMDKMKVKKDELDHHIMALGKAINADSINAKEVEKHASAIVELLTGKKMKDAMDHSNH